MGIFCNELGNFEIGRFWNCFFNFPISKFQNQMSSFSFSTTLSISSFVLFLLNEKRTVTWLGLLFTARITCEPWSAPLVQALPPLAQILLISRLKSIISLFSVLGKLALNTAYRLLPNGSPLNATPLIFFFELFKHIYFQSLNIIAFGFIVIGCHL